MLHFRASHDGGWGGWDYVVMRVVFCVCVDLQEWVDCMDNIVDICSVMYVYWDRVYLGMAHVQPLCYPFIYWVGSDMIWFYGLMLESIWYRCVEIGMVVAVICCVDIDR